MRKVLITSFLSLMALVLSYGLAFAISGQCVNCHTMHNSQNGLPMTVGGGPFLQLLRADCIPCHTGPRDIVDYPLDKKNSFGAPIVLDTSNPNGQGGGSTLAGGDFWWVATAGGHTDSMGHNVATIANEDQFIGGNIAGFTPPGWDPTATPSKNANCLGQINNGQAWGVQVTCAGLYGCHGNHSDTNQMAAIKGAHHGNTGGTSTSATNPTSSGGSYRFLCGIKGLENGSWNFNETSSSHNEYYGVPSNVGYADTSTISYSCAECHGVFHSGIGPSPYLRHPTDIPLTATPGSEYLAYTVYSVQAPVARSAVPANSSQTVTPGSDIVMCLSCHRAHGSNFPDLLRWNYSTMIAGAGGPRTGCFTCHTQK